MTDRPLRVLGVEQGERGLMFAEFHLIRKTSIFLLQMRRIEKADLTEFRGYGGGPDAPAKTLAHKYRQHPGMINMRVSEDQVVDRGGLDLWWIPIHEAKVLRPL